MPARSIVVSGHVQGVGYRAFTQELAQSYGIAGEVWNRPDGTVALFAEHSSPETLSAFEHRLFDGPGRIDSVVGHESEPTGVTTFSVGRTRQADPS